MKKGQRFIVSMFQRILFWRLLLGVIFVAALPRWSAGTQVYALEGVGAQVKEVSEGETIEITGRHAPRSQVVVSYGDEVVSAVLDEGQGDFTFEFEADDVKADSLEVFGIDKAGTTARVRIPSFAKASEGEPFVVFENILLPPTIVQDPLVDLGDDGLGVGGYSYPGAVVTVILEGPTGLVVTDETVTEADGGWQHAYDGLSPGYYVARATSEYQGTVSQVSQDLEFEIVAPAGRAVMVGGDLVGRVVRRVVPPRLQEVAEELADEAELVTQALAPLVGTGLLAQALLMTQTLWYWLVQLVTTLLQLLGLWHKRRPWGVVYDAVTKQPVAYVIVRLLAVDKKMALVATDVTGNSGVFNFFPQAGWYVIKVIKGGYRFPSKLVLGGRDGEYAHVYHGEQIRFEGEKSVVDVSVPIDPLKPKIDWKFRVKNLVRQRVGVFVRVTMGLGLVMALVSVIGGKGGISGVLLVVYVVVTGLQWAVRRREKRSWGVVVDRVGKPVEGVQLNLVDSRFERLVQRRMTGPDGRYQFVVPEGQYEIKVVSVGHNLVKGVKGAYLGEEIVVRGKRPKLVAQKMVVGRGGGK